jgi:hypothetical protein
MTCRCKKLSSSPAVGKGGDTVAVAVGRAVGEDGVGPDTAEAVSPVELSVVVVRSFSYPFLPSISVEPYNLRWKLSEGIIPYQTCHAHTLGRLSLCGGTAEECGIFVAQHQTCPFSLVGEAGLGCEGLRGWSDVPGELANTDKAPVSQGLVRILCRPTPDAYGLYPTTSDPPSHWSWKLKYIGRSTTIPGPAVTTTLADSW